MKLQHYDVIILGGGTVSRLAALLAGRRGRRVLIVDDLPEGGALPPLPCCRHLTSVLPLLGIKSRQLRSAGTLQLIGEQHRLNLTGRESAQEWRRELMADADQPLQFLDALAAWGENLARRLVERGPDALTTPAWRLGQTLRSRLARGNGVLPDALLSGYLQRHMDREPRHLLQDLFAALSGLPAAQLRLSQAALLWHWARLPRVLNGDLLWEALIRRAEQFRVYTVPAARLETIFWKKGRPDAIALDDGSGATAPVYVLTGAALATMTSPPGKPQDPCFTIRQSWRTTPISDQLSPLLGERVVLAGPTPLLATRQRHDDGTRFLIEGGTQGKVPPLDAARVAERLVPLAPFSPYALEEVTRPTWSPHRHFDTPGASPAKVRAFLDAVPGRNVPGLGANGEILLGLALAERLR